MSVSNFELNITSRVTAGDTPSEGSASLVWQPSLMLWRPDVAQTTGNLTSVVTAPVSIITCADVKRASVGGARASFFSLVDVSFASLLILLGAVEQGLGACFVGSYNPEELAKLLELPDHVRPVGIITIGYPAEQPQKPKSPKIPMSKLLHREKW